MTESQKHEIFMNYVGYNSAEIFAEKFGVSARTINRYREQETAIPDTIIKIIKLSKENEKKAKTIDNLQFELTSIKQCINDFKETQGKLFRILD